MSAVQIFIALGLCSGYVPNDNELTEALCSMQLEASMRRFEPLVIPAFPEHPYRARPEIELTYTLPDRRLWRR